MGRAAARPGQHNLEDEAPLSPTNQQCSELQSKTILATNHKQKTEKYSYNVQDGIWVYVYLKSVIIR